MKTPLAIFLAAGVGFAAAWFLAGRQKDAAFTQERLALQAETTAARSTVVPIPSRSRAGEGARFARPSSPMPVAAPAASEILEKLKTMRVPSGPRQSMAMRHVIHQLQNLVDLGPSALSAIRDFMGKFEDVDYGYNLNRDDRDAPRHDRPPLPGERAASSVTETPQLDFSMPPSLRLGLVDVLKEIGGANAEQILAELVSTSGRGVEVAYAARALQEMAPNKYRDTAITAAKDLLANPPTIERPSPLDERARAYLYTVLELYGTNAVPANVQALLVTEDGHIDRTTLNYLAALQEQAVPALVEAYRDPRVTNLSEKSTLAAQILSYAGLNEHANEAFHEMVSDENTAAWLRALSIQSLAGGRGAAFTGAMPTDTAQLQARIDLLSSLGELPDETMARAQVDAITRLSNRLETLTNNASTTPTFRARSAAPPLPVQGLPQP